MSDRTQTVTEVVQKRLHAMTAGPHAQPDIASLLNLCENILPIIHEACPTAETPVISAEQVREKMERGLPLLSGLDLSMDIAALRSRMIALAEAYANQFCDAGGNDSLSPRAEAALLIRSAFEEERLDAGELLQVVLSGNTAALETDARSWGLEPGLLLLITLNALKPVLRHWQRSLAPLLSEMPWDKEYCLFCGTRVSMGELRNDNQEKHLRCCICGADWKCRRLQCIYCGNENHRSLGYMYPEGQHEQLRVEFCDKCKGYVKLVSTFSPNTPEMLDVEDIATTHLDCIARERGYSNNFQ